MLFKIEYGIAVITAMNVQYGHAPASAYFLYVAHYYVLALELLFSFWGH
jgi:hypothetical protein